MKIVNLFILSLIILSCRSFCEDDELGIKREDNLSSKIKLSGYFYGDVTGENPNTPGIYFFFENGVFFL